MGVRILSVWEGVPDADVLKDKLFLARNRNASLQDRQAALSYLTGAAKVLAGLEKRKALADYLRGELAKIKTSLYYSRSNDGDQAHG